MPNCAVHGARRDRAASHGGSSSAARGSPGALLTSAPSESFLVGQPEPTELLTIPPTRVHRPVVLVPRCALDACVVSDGAASLPLPEVLLLQTTLDVPVVLLHQRAVGHEVG